MTKQKTKEWLDLVAAIAIVAGLVLVAYEVRQANIVAKATTDNSIYEGWEVLSMAEIETGIKLDPAHRRQIVAIRIGEQAVEQSAGGVDCRRFPGGGGFGDEDHLGGVDGGERG